MKNKKQSKAKYDSKEKKYYVKRTKKSKLNNKIKIAIFLFTAIIFLAISAIFIVNSIDLTKTTQSVNYNEIGKIDYKVYLKENNYYTEKYLPKGMKYIANLISTINVDFSYELHATELLNYDYKYKIDAKLVITDKNENTKVLYEKPFKLTEEISKNGNGNVFLIKDDIDIDYDEYNNYVNSFKRDYGLTVNSNLIITMTISTNSSYNEKNLANNNTLTLQIPMSEQTIDITMNGNELNNSGSIAKNSKSLISNISTFIIGVSLGTISIIICFVSLYIYLKKVKKKDLYHLTINKYLKDFDRIIVTSKQPNVDERLFDEIIRVMDIKELVDLHDMSQKPIIYYEVIPNEKSYFIIINDRLLYKLTITKAWLERQNEESNKTK